MGFFYLQRKESHTDVFQRQPLRPILRANDGRHNVLGNYTFSADQSGISFSVSGNKLTVTANTAPSGKVSITATKTGSVRKGVVVWSDGVITPGSGIQDLSTYSAEVNDPVKGYLNIKVSLGSAKIVKTSEDGKVSGITFTITGNGVNKTVTTGANGEIVIDNLSPGTYTVTEQSANYYEPQKEKTVNIFFVAHRQKETTIFDRRLSFLFVLFTFLFSFFSLPSNCRFQIKDKKEEIKEKVALLRKALILITNYYIIHSEVMMNEQSFTR